MAAVNFSMSSVKYVGKENSMNSTTQCTFVVALILRYAGTPIIVLGFIGNFLSIIIFSRKTLRTRSCAIYFLALNMSDVGVLFGHTFENLLPNGYGIHFLSNSFMCKSIIFLIYALADISNYLLMLAAIDRCVLVTGSSARYRFCRKKFAKRAILFVVLLFGFINSHLLFGFHVDERGSCLIKSGFYASFYRHHYDSYVDIIKSVLVPFATILICNALIISRITRQKKLMINSLSTRKSRRRQEKDRQLTCFLLITSILFILLILPSEMNDFIRPRLSQEFQEKYVCQMWTSTQILILVQQINYASHFYVYTLTGPIFRKEFKKFICQCRQQRLNRSTFVNYIPQQPSIGNNINRKASSFFIYTYSNDQSSV